jgi:hypothetical protein
MKTCLVGVLLNDKFDQTNWDQKIFSKIRHVLQTRCLEWCWSKCAIEYFEPAVLASTRYVCSKLQNWSICRCSSSPRIDIREWSFKSTHWFARNISTKKYVMRSTVRKRHGFICGVLCLTFLKRAWPSYLHQTWPGWLPSKYIQCDKLKTL